MRTTPRVILILKQASSAARLHKNLAQKLVLTVLWRIVVKSTWKEFKRGWRSYTWSSSAIILTKTVVPALLHMHQGFFVLHLLGTNFFVRFELLSSTENSAKIWNGQQIGLLMGMLAKTCQVENCEQTVCRAPGYDI